MHTPGYRYMLHLNDLYEDNSRSSLMQYPVERALLVRLAGRSGRRRGRRRRLLLLLRHFEQVGPLVDCVLLEGQIIDFIIES